jgi:hypothetical protein
MENISSKLELYQSSDGSIQLDVHLDRDTVWLPQSQMIHLFEKDKRTISEPIRNSFKDQELEEQSVVRNFRTTDRLLSVSALPGAKPCEL